MSEEVVTRKRLILGYDAGCGTCSDLAQRIEEQVGDKLEVRSLSDPKVEHWRKREMGEDAPWVPTLVEVDSGKTKVWTGLAMGLVLSRKLGPAATWRVMQVLGDIGAAARQDRPSMGSALSRSKFLKGMVGTGAALTLMVFPGGTAEAACGYPGCCGCNAYYFEKFYEKKSRCREEGRYAKRVGNWEHYYCVPSGSGNNPLWRLLLCGNDKFDNCGS